MCNISSPSNRVLIYRRSVTSCFINGFSLMNSYKQPNNQMICGLFKRKSSCNLYTCILILLNKHCNPYILQYGSVLCLQHFENVMGKCPFYMTYYKIYIYVCIYLCNL